MNLRDHSQVKIKKLIQYDEQQEEKHMQTRSRRWWVKVDKRYFKKFGVEQFRQLRDRIINQVKLNQALPISPVIQNTKAQYQWSYFHNNIYTKNTRLFDRKNIRVLFNRNVDGDQPSQEWIFLAYSFGFKYQQSVDDQHSSYDNIIDLEKSSENIQKSQNLQLEVNYMKQQLPANINDPQQIEQITNLLQLTAKKSSSDIQLITRCNVYDLNVKNYFHSEIQMEIALWEEQLRNVASFNEDTWNLIERNLLISNEENLRDQNQYIQKQKIDQEVTTIHQFLAWQHNLINFKNGFADKNQQMLAQALQGMWIKQNETKNMGDKKKFFKASIENLMQTKSQLSTTFETDCKICFSTYVSQKNKVIYCDSCNESFHEKCYGIVDLNQDPDSKFYCDTCQFMMEQANKKTPYRPSCEICHVDFSPLKNIDGVFFHPSCLFLNNLLKPKLGVLQFSEEFTTQLVINKVKQIQQHNEDNQCQFCTQNSLSGLRFKCAQPECKRYFHTICAYLHSNEFKVWRNHQNLQMQIRCWQHFPHRDNHRQAYLRRFFCNYKNIADLTENEFIQIYKEEIDNIKQYKMEQKTKSTSIPQQDMQNNQNSNSISQSKSSKNKLKRNKNDTQQKSKKKHKKKQKSAKKSQQIKDFIDLNSDDQQNTDYHNNTPSERSQQKITTTTNDKNFNQMKIQQQLKKSNSQQLKVQIEKLQNQLINKKKKSQQQDYSVKKSIDISKYLSLLDDNLGSDFHSFSDQSLIPCQINATGSFQQSIISE